MDEKYKAGKKVARLGIVTNILLLAAKLVVGYMSRSQAMIADGYNSVGDVFASAVTYAGSSYASKPRDEDHAWGHGKAEYIASMIIGFAMMAMAVYTIISSVHSLFEGAALTFSYWLVSAAVLTLCVKACLYVYTTKVNSQYNSILIRANAQDHRNDMFVATGTLAAVLLSLTGAYWVDGAVGIGISCWIVYTGFGIMKDASKVLMDSNASVDMLRKYEDEIEMIDGVDHIDSVVAMPVGATYILIAKVSVDRNLSVMEGHAISKRIEQLLLEKQQEIEDVIVHINPDLPHQEE